MGRAAEGDEPGSISIDDARTAMDGALYGKAAGILRRLLDDTGLQVGDRLLAQLMLGVVLEARSERRAALDTLRDVVRALETVSQLRDLLPAQLTARGYVILGYRLAEENELSEAERVLRKCLSLPDVDADTNSIALGNLGCVLAKMNRHEESIEVRRAFVSAAGAAGHAVYAALEELSISLLAAERYGEAQETIVRAIRSVPAPPLSEMSDLLRLAAVTASKKGEDALSNDYVREAEHYLQFATDEERRRETVLELGRIAWNNGEFQVVLRIGRSLAREQDVAMWREGVDHLTRALYRLEQDEECLEECERAIADARVDRELELKLRELSIYAASHLQRWDVAREHFRLGERVGLTLEKYPELQAYFEAHSGRGRERKMRWFGH